MTNPMSRKIQQRQIRISVVLQNHLWKYYSIQILKNYRVNFHISVLRTRRRRRLPRRFRVVFRKKQYPTTKIPYLHPNLPWHCLVPCYIYILVYLSRGRRNHHRNHLSVTKQHHCHHHHFVFYVHQYQIDFFMFNGLYKHCYRYV